MPKKNSVGVEVFTREDFGKYVQRKKLHQYGSRIPCSYRGCCDREIGIGDEAVVVRNARTGVIRRVFCSEECNRQYLADYIARLRGFKTEA